MNNDPPVRLNTFLKRVPMFFESDPPKGNHRLAIMMEIHSVFTDFVFINSLERAPPMSYIIAQTRLRSLFGGFYIVLFGQPMKHQHWLRIYHVRAEKQAGVR